MPGVVSAPPLDRYIATRRPLSREGPPRLTPARSGARSLAIGSEQGGPFRDLRASLEQRPVTDDAHRLPDHQLGGLSRGRVSSEPQLPSEADRPQPPATFLSADECARRAMLSRKAIYRAIESGELLAFRVRARLRVPEDEFSRWMTADPVSRTPSGPAHGISARRPVPAGSFRSVLRTVERGQA
jgi:excisionase family DNA binding protein